MFRSALVKLTLIYVVLAMAFSLTFSAVLYRFASQELSEGLHHQFQELRDDDHDADNAVDGDNTDNISASELHIRETSIKYDLTYLNSIVLVGSILAGYFLARRTLRPIQEAHRSQIRFTAEASHELKTPLTAMKADTESVLMQHTTNVKELRKTLERNLDDIARLEALTKHLLDMGRYRSGDPLRSEEVKLAQLVQIVIGQMEAKYPDKQLQFERNIPGEVKLQVDPTALEQLLVIVMDNASKYSSATGTIRIHAHTEVNGVVIAVVDEGIGIPEADLPHIFEYFYRSSSTALSLKASGYGLGLPLANDIVRACKGSIAVKSKPKRGTTVTIRLPLKST